MRNSAGLHLDASLPHPLYLQARDRLLAIIMKRAVGETLPHERNLAVEWGVSRITIRNAYSRLVDEGYVMKAHKAYKVAPRLSSTGLFMLEGFTKDARARGNVPRTEVLGVELIYPESNIAELLLLAAGQRTYRLARKRFLNDRLIALEYAYVGEALAPGLDKHRLESLYEVLLKEYGLQVHWAQQNFSFCFEKAPEHEGLELNQDTPLLHLERVSFSPKNTPVEYVNAYYNVRDLEFYLEIRR